MVLKTRNLLVASYSDYQQFLHDTIMEFREKGLTFKQIATWLHENGYATAHGKKFYATHVFSIAKKKRLRDERLNREVDREYRNFDLRFIERVLINSE